MPILELAGITHQYNGKRVLDIPTLLLEKGEIYSLVGPNGSGKTTLLSIMSLILKPTTGKIYYKGAPVSYNDKSFQTIRRAMTMVTQNPYLFNMSVFKNVAFGLRARRVHKRDYEVTVKDALDLVGLKGFEKRRAKELSGGETQLVALARALVLNPAILLLDEPTANVDSRHINQFEETIIKINREMDMTIVMTTHNLSQAYRITERVLSLFDGSLVTSPIHNLFYGGIHLSDKGPYLNTGKIRIWISEDTQTSDIAHIAIDPEDIILSKTPFTSSARNVFNGVIKKIIDQGGKILIEVHSYEIFNVLITKKSFMEMGINAGSNVYLTFKASSVHIL